MRPLAVRSWNRRIAGGEKAGAYMQRSLGSILRAGKSDANAAFPNAADD